MLRDRRLVHLQAHHDVPNSPLLKRQIIQNLPPAGLRYPLKESEVVAALAISSGAVDAAAPEPTKQLLGAMSCGSQTHNHIKHQQCRVHTFLLFPLSTAVRKWLGSLSLLTPGLGRGLLYQLRRFFRLREHGHVCEFSLALHQMMAETDRSHTEDTKFEDWAQAGVRWW